MKKAIAVAALSLVLVACGQDQTEVDSVEVSAPSVEKKSGILVEHMNLLVKPGEDFNAFVNGTWIENAVIPADRASDSVGLMVHEESVANVRAIIEESAAGDYAKGSDEQKVGDLYASYMDMETRNNLGVTPLAAEFEKIDALQNHQELAVYFSAANKIGANMPFALGQYVDFKNPKSYMMYTWQGGLGLPDREYYSEQGERSDEIRDAYVKHIEAMFQLAGLPDGVAAASMIMALETRMAAVHMKKEQTRDMVALYNKIALDELSELMPNFAWDVYLTDAGINDIDGLVVTMLDHMRALDGIIGDTSLEDWKTYLTWSVLTANAHLLDNGVRSILIGIAPIAV